MPAGPIIDHGRLTVQVAQKYRGYVMFDTALPQSIKRVSAKRTFSAVSASRTARKSGSFSGTAHLHYQS